TRSTVTLITEQDVTQMANVEGVYDFEQNNNQATFSADPQHLNIILNEASKLDVKKFESVPPTLEDLFMRHYERQTHRRRVKDDEREICTLGYVISTVCKKRLGQNRDLDRRHWFVFSCFRSCFSRNR